MVYDFSASENCTPPPYSKLEEESNGLPQNGGDHRANPRPPQMGGGYDYPLEEGKPDSHVTLHLRDGPKGKKRQFLLRHFLCGCSLRSGCITVAVLYSIYMLFFLCVAIAIFVIAYNDNQNDFLINLWGLHGSLFECCMAGFTVVFISLGVHKRNSQRLHLAKWLIIVDVCLNFLEEVQIAFFANIYGMLIHLVIQVIPIYFIFIIHSYEYELLSETKKPSELPQTRVSALTSSNPE